MAITVNKINNVEAYLDGNNQLLGMLEEINLPNIKTIMQDHKALGMMAKLELPAGLDKMEMTIKANSQYPELMKALSHPTKPASLQLRYNINGYTEKGIAKQQKGVIFVTATPTERDMGKFKQHDNADFNAKLKVTYIKQLIDGEELLEIDVYNNVYRVNGEGALSV